MDWKERKALGITRPDPTPEERDRFMREALAEARLAMDDGEVPIGAVVVRDGEVVGRGHNRRETGKNALYHAEVLAIDDACKTLGGWRLWECDLYVTLEPCPMCAARPPRLLRREGREGRVGRKRHEALRPAVQPPADRAGRHPRRGVRRPAFRVL